MDLFFFSMISMVGGGELCLNSRLTVGSQNMSTYEIKVQLEGPSVGQTNHVLFQLFVV